MNTNDKSKESLIDTVTDFGGSAISGTVGAAIGGPIGAVSGAIAGTAIEKITKRMGEEIKNRLLSKSEEKKLDAAYSETCKKITAIKNSGRTLRNDGFFAESEQERSTAEEIFEGTLFASQRESEEKKIKYYAKLCANIAFDDSISRPMANQLIKIVGQLTYRQIVILHVIGNHQLVPQANFFRNTAYSSVSGLTNVTIASEIFEMYRMSLLSSTNVILDNAGINPSALSITGYGALLFNLMELKQLEPDDDLSIILMEIISFLTDIQYDNTTTL